MDNKYISFPSDEKLDKQFEHLSNNKDVLDISYWKEHNHASKTDEEELLNKAVNHVELFKDKAKDVLQNWSEESC